MGHMKVREMFYTSLDLFAATIAYKKEVNKKNKTENGNITETEEAVDFSSIKKNHFITVKYPDYLGNFINKRI